MSREREKLVDLITQKVMDELRSGRVRPGQASPLTKGSEARSGAKEPSFAPQGGASEGETRQTVERFHAFGAPAVRSPEEARTLEAAGADRVVSTLGYCPPSDSMARKIDHTLLKPEARREDVEQLCREAAEFCFASVCVNPNWVPLCRDMLKGTGVKVCTVVGFPLGAHAPDVKAYEAKRAVEQGAEEVDMVINIGALKSRDYALVEQDIRGVVDAAGPSIVVKVILETCLLDRDEIVMGASLSKAAGAHYVKTSTGFSTGGATVEDVRLMRETVGPEIGVKASGGIRTQEDAEAMIAAGATRLGASAGVKIVRGEKGEGKY